MQKAGQKHVVVTIVLTTILSPIKYGKDEAIYNVNSRQLISYLVKKCQVVTFVPCPVVCAFIILCLGPVIL